LHHGSQSLVIEFLSTGVCNAKDAPDQAQEAGNRKCGANPYKHFEHPRSPQQQFAARVADHSRKGKPVAPNSVAARRNEGGIFHPIALQTCDVRGQRLSHGSKSSGTDRGTAATPEILIEQWEPDMDMTEDEKSENYRVTAGELRQFIERFERLDAEKKDIAEQQKEVMAEAKARGYDTKVMRKVIALRKRDKDDIAEEEAVLEMYKEALGM